MSDTNPFNLKTAPIVFAIPFLTMAFVAYCAVYL